KLRVIPNAINVDWVKALGANPTPLPFPEVYAALDQKAIDGQENPATVISANKLYEVQKHIVLSNHQYNPQSLIFSKKVWDTLTVSDRKIMVDAGVEASKYQRQVARDAAGTALENLKKNGMQVTELSALELDRSFRGTVLLHPVRGSAARHDHARSVFGAPEQSDAVVAKDDAASPQHGEEPVPRQSDFRKRAGARPGHDPLFAVAGQRQI